MVCLGVQYLGYERVLAAALREAAPEARQRGLKRWVLFAVAWQSAVVVAVLVYAFVARRGHPSGLAWIAPPLAALVGTAIPYQLAAVRLARAGRG